MRQLKAAPVPQLPVKWKHSASDVDKLPTLEMAMQTFRRAYVKNNIGLVRLFHIGRSRICVYGCKLAVEYTGKQTLHMRMRPPGAPCLIDAAQVLSWPELNSFGNLLIRGAVQNSWLAVATADVFEAWSKTFLPDGYRYADPLRAVKDGFPELRNSEQHREWWIAEFVNAMPQQFLQSFDLTVPRWMALPDLVAPMRVWNHHREELIHPDLSDAWVRLVKPILASAPVDLELGDTLDQSIRNLIVSCHSLTVWRFHRQSHFRLLTRHEGAHRDRALEPMQFSGHDAHLRAQLIIAAVKGAGMKRAQGLLLKMGEDRIGRIVGALAQMNVSDVTVPHLTRVMARAADRVEAAVDVLPQALDEVVHVVRGLARAGFELGFPAPNATWGSLVERAHDWGGADALWRNGENLPTRWKVAIPKWQEGWVTFSALQSLKELKAEGVQMRHCVDTHHQPCAVGISVIYGISGWLSIGEKVRATVEFERNFKIGGWSITQIVGRENSSVDPKLKELAGRLAKALSEHRAK